MADVYDGDSNDSTRHLRLQIAQYEELRGYVLAASSDEVCGYLAGVGRNVAQVIPITNVAHDTSHSFYMEPQAQLNALVAVQAHEWDIVAVYHSHPPGSRTDPSRTDIDKALDSRCLHVIAVYDPAAATVSLRAFSILEGEVAEVPVTVENLDVAADC